MLAYTGRGGAWGGAGRVGRMSIAAGELAVGRKRTPIPERGLTDLPPANAIGRKACARDAKPEGPRQRNALARAKFFRWPGQGLRAVEGFAPPMRSSGLHSRVVAHAPLFLLPRARLNGKTVWTFRVQANRVCATTKGAWPLASAQLRRAGRRYLPERAALINES